MGWIKSVWGLLFPPLCEACGCRLMEGERFLCVECVHGLARTELHREREGRFEKLFWGKFPIERAAAYYFYDRSEGVRQLVHAIKYSRRMHAGHYVGALVTRKMMESSDFFDGIDVIIPVPLHPRKRRARGYNQSEVLAQGMSEASGIPVKAKSVERKINNPTQTRLNQTERSKNVENIFRIVDVEQLRGKHVLLIDDVITTGSTLSSLGKALTQEVEGVRISVFALAVAHV